MALAVAADPLESAWAFRVRRSPAGAEREIDVAITVNVVRLDANIVPGRCAVERCLAWSTSGSGTR